MTTLCGPVRAGQRRGSLGEKKGRIWLIIYQCQPHNDSPRSPPIDEDNYISSEWLINKAQGKWFIIAPPKRLFFEREGGRRGGGLPLLRHLLLLLFLLLKCFLKRLTCTIQTPWKQNFTLTLGFFLFLFHDCLSAFLTSLQWVNRRLLFVHPFRNKK